MPSPIGGLDPRYVGWMSAGPLSGQVAVDLTFFEDALVGIAIWQSPQGERAELAVGGTRDGAEIQGYAADARAHDPQAFQMDFEGSLVTASVIELRFIAAWEGREAAGHLRLVRVTACGCDGDAQPEPPVDPDPEEPDPEEPDPEQPHPEEPHPEEPHPEEPHPEEPHPEEPHPEPLECQRNHDCAEGEVCLDGQCCARCVEHVECPEAQSCDEGVCQPEASP